MTGRDLAKLLNAGRVVVGAGLMVAPAQAGRPWIGDDAARPATAVFARAFGARDLALGLGTLLSLRDGLTTRRWMQAGVLSDAVDLGATLAARRALPRAGVIGTAVVAGSAAAVGLALANRLD
jgi:hypothetical protein